MMIKRCLMVVLIVCLMGANFGLLGCSGSSSSNGNSTADTSDTGSEDSDTSDDSGAMDEGSSHPLVISELMYNPKGGDIYEYIELMNMSDESLDISGYYFKSIDFTFPTGSTITAGAYVVIARDRESFYGQYGFYPDVVYESDPDYLEGVDDPSDQYKQLSDSGEKVKLKSTDGETIFSVNYSDKGEWQRGADGFGYSLVLVDKNDNSDDPFNWRASAAIHGSPGEADWAIDYGFGVVINEVYAHTDGNDRDSIELHNPTNSVIDVSGWYLADEKGSPSPDNPESMKMYKIPEGTIIASNGHFTCNEENFYDDNPDISFALSEFGDEVYLYSVDVTGGFTGYMLGQSFGATNTGQSVGRYQTSDGVDFTILEAVTLGSTNSDPLVGPVVINEIMYNPYAGNTVEFIELYNNETWSVDLSGWELEGINFEFPAGTIISAQGYLLIIDSAASDDTEIIDDFRDKHQISDNIPIFADAIVLENEGETLILKRTNGEELEENINYITVDKVDYNDKEPWPETADGEGSSLERIDSSSYGNDPENWQASSEDGGSPGAAN